MASRITLFLICLLMAFPVASQVHPLSVMTFNIRYDNPSDSLYNWNHRKDMVCGVFRKYKPDIAGLQEVLHSQLTCLKDSLKEYAWFGVGREDGDKKGEYTPIGYNSSRFVKVDGAYFWLSKTPEVPGSKSWKTGCTRIVTWVMLRDRKSMQLFFVFNTHLDNASEEARVESAKLLRSKLDEICSARPVIIMGDFNTTSSGEAYSILTSKKYPGNLTDTRSCSPDSLSAPSFSFVGFPYQPKEGELIDFIFKRNAASWKVKSYTIVTDNRDGFYPSDHLPVITEFELNGPKK